LPLSFPGLGSCRCSPGSRRRELIGNHFTAAGCPSDWRRRLKEFVQRHGQPFSEALGIDLNSRRAEELSKWFLASILYSKPIRESTATLTYRTFEREGVVTPSRVLETGWEGLVSLLDEGGYARYDFSTASKLLEVFGNLQRRYGGDLNRLHEGATGSGDLEKKLRDLGKGIGATTVSVFLRDMRPVWNKANAEPSPLVRLAMDALGISDVANFARRERLDPVRLETALLRLGRDRVRRGKSLDVRVD
jgi:hypothetical protein